MTTRNLSKVILVTAFLLGVVLPAHATGTTTSQSAGSNVSLTLYGSVISPNGWGFSPATITNPGPAIIVPPGASVTLKLISQDPTIIHQFCVDYEPTPDYSCNTPSELQTESPIFRASGATYAFTATTVPGNYTYFCVFHTSLMKGPFVVQAPDFAISARPGSLSIMAGETGTSIISLTSITGFSGPILLSAASDPAGLLFVMNGTSVELSVGESRNVQLNVTAPVNLSTAVYNVTVTGSSGGLVHSAMLRVTISDFTITAMPTSVNTFVAIDGVSNVTIVSLNGLTGTVTLSLVTTPSTLACTLSRAQIQLGIPGDSKLSCSSTIVGTYQVAITGTIGTLTRTIAITFTVSAHHHNHHRHQSHNP